MKNNSSKPKILVISEVFYPNSSATSLYITGIVNYLKEVYSISVLTTQPRNFKEISIDNIDYIRINIDEGKSLFSRIFRAINASWSMFWYSLKIIKRYNLVFVVSNPPLLPSVISILCKLNKINCICRIDDVYPNVLASTGIITKESILYKFLYQIINYGYRYATKIIVLSSDMKDLISNVPGVKLDQLEVINNWADVDLAYPLNRNENLLLRRLSILDKFVILIAGNIGYAQDIETILKSSILLKDTNVTFLFVGSGALYDYVKNFSLKHNSQNIHLTGNLPRSEQPIFLNACDVCLLSLKSEMYGIGAPSRFYNYLSAGKPVIALVDSRSEISNVVTDYSVGWQVNSGDYFGLAELISHLTSLPNSILNEMGKKCVEIAADNYHRDVILAKYKKIIEETILS
jgi:glycosyltransferase involved in cell wall biosynthesis